jgi:hypothetical protein
MLSATVSATELYIVETSITVTFLLVFLILIVCFLLKHACKSCAFSGKRVVTNPVFNSALTAIQIITGLCIVSTSVLILIDVEYIFFKKAFEYRVRADLTRLSFVFLYMTYISLISMVREISPNFYTPNTKTIACVRGNRHLIAVSLAGTILSLVAVTVFILDVMVGCDPFLIDLLITAVGIGFFYTMLMFRIHYGYAIAEEISTVQISKTPAGTTRRYKCMYNSNGIFGFLSLICALVFMMLDYKLQRDNASVGDGSILLQSTVESYDAGVRNVVMYTLISLLIHIVFQASPLFLLPFRQNPLDTEREALFCITDDDVLSNDDNEDSYAATPTTQPRRKSSKSKKINDSVGGAVGEQKSDYRQHVETSLTTTNQRDGPEDHEDHF